MPSSAPIGSLAESCNITIPTVRLPTHTGKYQYSFKLKTLLSGFDQNHHTNTDTTVWDHTDTDTDMIRCDHIDNDTDMMRCDYRKQKYFLTDTRCLSYNSTIPIVTSTHTDITSNFKLIFPKDHTKPVFFQRIIPIPIF